MLLSRTKFRKSFILSTKKWIKCFPGKNPVNSRGKSGDITRFTSVVGLCWHGEQCRLGPPLGQAHGPSAAQQQYWPCARAGPAATISFQPCSSCRDLCNIMCMQKAQQDAWAQRSVRRGATCKVVSMQQVSFLLLYRIFPSFRYVPGKKRY